MDDPSIPEPLGADETASPLDPDGFVDTAAGGEGIFTVGGDDPFTDPVIIVDPWWTSDPPQIVILGGPDPVMYPANPYTGPATWTSPGGFPGGEPVPYYDPPQGPAPAPGTWTSPGGFPGGEPVPFYDPAHGTDQGPGTWSVPPLSDLGPISPDMDPLGLPTTEINMDSREAQAAWATRWADPLPVNADGTPLSAIQIYTVLMEREPDPDLRNAYFNRIQELNESISNAARNPF